jgi:hypothetical protein
MKRSILTILVLTFISIGCRTGLEKDTLCCEALNCSHLQHLYDEILLPDGTAAGIVHIYSEYPDYQFAIEPNEGYTCVDDVARAVVFLAGYDSADCIEKNSVILDKMMNFLLSMQSRNGYFHNFIWHDGSINTTYRTSQARPDWWSWRAFWAMESYALLNEGNSDRIATAAERLAEKIFADLISSGMKTQEINGVTVPKWLPWESAADQAGVLTLALELYYKRTGEVRAAELISQLADGMLLMQLGDSLTFPYGAFLSWNNIWHAYGNIQSYALLKAGKTLGEPRYIKQALREIDHFYPWLIDQGYLSNFTVKAQGAVYSLEEQQKYPQIAYGFRPMIFACTEAFEITGERKYLEMAQRIASWFFGRNDARNPLYDMNSGRCYDAINSTSDINLNSGAESTIEALLALRELEEAGVDIREIYE